MNRLLVIDDDRELCELLATYLSNEGFDVDTVSDPVAGVERAVQGSYDLVVLDVMMPRMNGFDVLRRIREASKVAVVMLTARGDDVDRIVGLEIGADDYVPKPFNSRELVARIRAILRRTGPDTVHVAPRPAPLTVGDLVLDPGMRSVSCGGTPVELTSVEYSILAVLVEHAGMVVGRDELARTALGRENSIYDRSVDVHISSIRRKLGADACGADRIKTVRNTGYQYVVSVDRGALRKS